MTKADAVDEETLALAVEEARELVPGAAVVATSAKTEQGLDELRAALAAAADAVEPAHATGADAAVRRPGRSRSTGSAPSPRARSGRDGSPRATSCARSPPASTSACGAWRCTTAPSTSPRPVSASRSACPGSSERSCGAATRSSSPVRTRRASAWTSRSRSSSRSPTARACTSTTARRRSRPRSGGSASGTRSCASPRPPSPPAETASCSARARPSAAGCVVDPAPPRHASLERIELLERGDVAATVHSPVRARDARHLVDDEPDGLERAGGWVFSGRGSPSTASGLERRLDDADPLDPGVAAASEPWAADVVPLLGLERRGAKLYRPGATGVAGRSRARGRRARGPARAWSP